MNTANGASSKTKVYLIGNQKGGSAKTTTSINISACLAEKGYKVLLIDADSQGNATTGMGFKNPDSINFTLSTALECVIRDEMFDPFFCIQSTKEGFDLLPANISLASLENTLVNAMNRERIMKQYIDMLRGHYDYIIIDSMPSLGMITINGLSAADHVIIPVQPASFSLNGLQAFIKTIGMVKRQINNNLDISGILLACVDVRTSIAKRLTQELRQAYGDSVTIYDSIIPRAVSVVHSQDIGMPILKYEQNGKVSNAYRAFTEEVLSNDKTA